MSAQEINPITYQRVSSTIVIFVVLTFNIALVFFLLLIVKSSLQCATEIINLID